MALLTNENIRLRALEPEDLELIFRWENDTSLWAMGNTLSPYSRYTIKEYIQDSRQHDIYELRQLRLMIEIVATEDVIGMIDLYDLIIKGQELVFLLIWLIEIKDMQRML